MMPYIVILDTKWHRTAIYIYIISISVGII